jgi:transposase
MPIAKEELQSLVAEGLSIRQIAARVDLAPTTVRFWLRRHALVTRRGGPRLEASSRARAAGRDEIEQECPRHGLTTFVGRRDGAYRCRKCASAAVVERRKRIKRILVAEAGGECRICGYDRYVGALEFHHLRPAEKRFALAGAGLARSLAAARSEARKCVLLCGNCHSEVEAGVTELP